jgi:glyoxylase I family protein
MLKKFNHVAFRCNDAEETVRFYTEVLGLQYTHGLTGDWVGSTGEFNPHLHIFLTLEDGSSIAFFEVPLAGPSEGPLSTPAWCQHTAFEIGSPEEFDAYIKRLEDHGVKYIGPIAHHDDNEKSVYFTDPNGLRIELYLPGTYPPDTDEAMRALAAWKHRRDVEGFKVPAVAE